VEALSVDTTLYIGCGP